MQQRWIIKIGLIVLLLGWASLSIAQQAVIPTEVIRSLQDTGQARVIIQLNVPFRPEGTLQGQ